MKKVLVLVLPLLAFLGGAVGGDFLHAGKSKAGEGEAGEGAPTTAGETATAGEAQTAAAEHSEAAAEAPAKPADAGHGASEGAEGDSADWYHFDKQFFVPILRNGSTTAVMVLSLTVEMPSSERTNVEAQEHRLRDALLNALMIQANTGGFDGNFTAEPNLDQLRTALLAAAQKAAGPRIQSILIEDIAKQDQ